MRLRTINQSRERASLLAAGLAVGCAGMCSSAYADSVSLSLGTFSGGTNLNISASSVAMGSGDGVVDAITARNAEPGGTSATVYTSTSAAQQFNYTFSFASSYQPTKAPYFNMTLFTANQNLFGNVTSFQLIDTTIGQTLATSANNISLAAGLTGNGLSLTDTFEVQLNLKAGSTGSFEGFGSVPLPASLVLFGSGLLIAGFAATRYRATRVSFAG